MTYLTSANGRVLIQHYEGFRADPAQLPDGNWVVGYGHVRVGEPGAALNQNEAAELLALDLAPVERLVNAKVIQMLTQSQFDALVSFAFSVGAEAFEQSQVLRRTNAGDFVAAACAMDAWRKSEVSGESLILDALVRRRAAEKALFLQELPPVASPSAFVRAKLDHAASILGAPVAYAEAPVVGSITPPPPKPEPTARLVEILKSEPATEALLLTQVVPDDAEVTDEDEIVTAHARPVARPMDGVREATRTAFEAQEARRQKHGFLFFKKEKPNAIDAAAPELPVDRRLRVQRTQPETRFNPAERLSGSFENAGLIALLLFGLALVAVGASLLVGGIDFVSIAASTALVVPGLAATLMAGFGLRRPQLKPAPVEA